ncbi:MAG TPA: fibronectin type III-like domain-contianing protein, partial [Atopobiaceae bacterium]|nr:fibronectin type III-like domain-contianing protein [Atopobiaceae bacterium]
TGCTAIGRVLAGDVNPSGRLADTYAYDALEAPATKNAGNFTYTVDGEDAKAKYVDYAEGIYVGYRYYETRYADASGVIDEAAYAVSVQYPFGYGLSYTTFDQKLVSHDEADGIVTVAIEVENTGDVAGKDVVQLYCTPPYTEGGIEKPQVELIAFGKTKLLAPGESQTIELTFSVEDLASFDYIDAGCYVLEAGAYRIRLMDNAHVEIDSFELAVDATVTFGASNKRAADEVAAETLFSAAAGDVVYVSRADWEGTLPTERVETKEAPAGVIDEMDVDNINALYCSADPEADDILTGQSYGLSLEDMVGAEFDDPRWIELVEQMSLEDMGKLIGFGGFSTVAVPSVGK